MELKLPIEATETQIRERCMVLADAEIIDVDLEDRWHVELTGLGKRYLEGELDMKYHQRPRWVRIISTEVFEPNRIYLL